MARSRFLPDNFTLALLTTVALASVLPAAGGVARFFEGLTVAAVGLLFFLHGAKLSRQAIVAGLSHWRLHLVVVASTFVLFPLLGWVLRPVLQPLVTPDLYLGVLFLCALPATVQSAIALTSIARGNIPAAICSASASSLLGIFLTPVLVKLMMSTAGEAAFSFDAVGKILVQLLLPFVLGQASRFVTASFMERHRSRLKLLDQAVIFLIVYGAFSDLRVSGVWRELQLRDLLTVVVIVAALLAFMFWLTWAVMRPGRSELIPVMRVAGMTDPRFSS